MQSVRQIQRLNDAELEKCVPPSASWHTDYRDTAYVHFGGLPFELSEGDVLTIFSQYGNPVHVNLIRDKETGKSRGFGFLKYEDQRSCDLAVDNLSGAGVLGRVLTVDHARYKLKEGEIEGDGMEADADPTQDDDTDVEGEPRHKRRRTSSADDGPRRPRLREELELATLLKEHDDDDPMKAYLVKEKKEQIAEALKRLSVREKDHRSSRRRHRRDGHDTHEQDSHRRERSQSPRPVKGHAADRHHRSSARHRSSSRTARSHSGNQPRSRRQRHHTRDQPHDESSADDEVAPAPKQHGTSEDRRSQDHRNTRSYEGRSR